MWIPYSRQTRAASAPQTPDDPNKEMIGKGVTHQADFLIGQTHLRRIRHSSRNHTFHVKPCSFNWRLSVEDIEDLTHKDHRTRYQTPSLSQTPQYFISSNIPTSDIPSTQSSSNREVQAIQPIPVSKKLVQADCARSRARNGDMGKNGACLNRPFRHPRRKG